MVQEQVRNPAQQHLAYDWNGIGPGRELDERRPTAPKVETRIYLITDVQNISTGYLYVID